MHRLAIQQSRAFDHLAIFFFFFRHANSVLNLEPATFPRGFHLLSFQPNAIRRSTDPQADLLPFSLLALYAFCHAFQSFSSCSTVSLSILAPYMGHVSRLESRASAKQKLGHELSSELSATPRGFWPPRTPLPRTSAAYGPIATRDLHPDHKQKSMLTCLGKLLCWACLGMKRWSTQSLINTLSKSCVVRERQAARGTVQDLRNLFGQAASAVYRPAIAELMSYSTIVWPLKIYLYADSFARSTEVLRSAVLWNNPVRF